jgi:adenosylhomocysteine nucleosidase
VVCVATANELWPLRRPLSLQARQPASDYPCYTGYYADQPLCVVQTGPGPSRAALATSWLTGEIDCTGIISLGLSGALTAALSPGSLVMGTEWVILTGTPPVRHDLTPTPDPRLFDLARRAANRCRASMTEGRFLTSDRLLHDRRAKSDCAARTGAIAVDMESGPIVETAGASGTRCVSVRAILDDLDTTLNVPPDRFLCVDGSLSWWKSGVAIASHPTRLASYLAVGRESSRAMGRLTAWLCCFLEDVAHDEKRS